MTTREKIDRIIQAARYLESHATSQEEQQSAHRIVQLATQIKEDTST